MLIWILNHYADTPDREATRTFDLCRELVRRGYETVVVAAGFSHYRLREEHVRDGRAWISEIIDGVRFVWVRTFSYRRSDWRRVINMISYSVRALIVGIAIPGRPDVIIGVSVHPLASLAAYVLARLKRCRFILEITDLWPETLIQFGELRARSPVSWVMRVLERFLFRRAERIIMLWPRADAYAVEQGVSREKVVWIPHGVDLSRYTAIAPYNGLRGERFTVMYAGGLVRANALDIILDAAGLLQEREVESVRFVLVGDGADRRKLMDRARALGVTNVEFRGAVSKRDLWKVLAEADAFVLSLADLPLYRYGISLNKLCDYMACGRPILFAGRPAYNPVHEAQAGITVPPADPGALAAAAKRLAELPPAERERMGANARKYVEQHHSIVKLADRLERVLLGQE